MVVELVEHPQLLEALKEQIQFFQQLLLLEVEEVEDMVVVHPDLLLKLLVHQEEMVVQVEVLELNVLVVLLLQPPTIYLVEQEIHLL